MKRSLVFAFSSFLLMTAGTALSPHVSMFLLGSHMPSIPTYIPRLPLNLRSVWREQANIWLSILLKVSLFLGVRKYRPMICMRVRYGCLSKLPIDKLSFSL
ncbi:hypothetical protein F4776DRAFT_629354 [Hypoxylon sp. NC0597]|nr:hypothetical protein F4776DRAFT_629354 [Hypoxylon sp. NC0597]